MKFFFPVVAALVLHSAHALDIKGIEVDKPTDCATIKALEIRQGRFFEACETGKNTWMHEVSFLSGKATMFFTQSVDRILLSTHVVGFKFEEALDALTIKYGPPKLEESVVQNRMGAQFKQVEATWEKGPIALILRRHSSRLNEPSLTLLGEQAMKEQELKRQERAQKGAGNI